MKQMIKQIMKYNDDFVITV